MKNFFYASILTMALCLNLSPVYTQEKLYVDPGTVYVAPNKIFVNFEGEFIEVTSIATDENGVFIEEPEAGFCGDHGYYPGSSTVCPKCLARKKKGK